jgi:hypothetical protein
MQYSMATDSKTVLMVYSRSRSQKERCAHKKIYKIHLNVMLSKCTLKCILPTIMHVVRWIKSYIASLLETDPPDIEKTRKWSFEWTVPLLSRVSRFWEIAGMKMFYPWIEGSQNIENNTRIWCIYQIFLSFVSIFFCCGMFNDYLKSIFVNFSVFLQKFKKKNWTP